jgi:hypothetical protein
MASPKLEVFFLFDSVGAPKTGQTGMSFSTYKTDLGVSVTPPAITELGGGAYAFLPAFADLDRGIFYVLDTNGATPLYYTRYMRPEDWAADQVPDVLADTERLLDINEGRWKVDASANQLILYKVDGVTELRRFNLFNSIGLPDVESVFDKVPV